MKPKTARFFHNDPKAPTPNRPIGVGALAIIERDGELLMELRSDCERGLPGGAVEADEAIEDALRREVLEETDSPSPNILSSASSPIPPASSRVPTGTSSASSPSYIASSSRASTGIPSEISTWRRRRRP